MRTRDTICSPCSQTSTPKHAPPPASGSWVGGWQSPGAERRACVDLRAQGSMSASRRPRPACSNPLTTPIAATWSEVGIKSLIQLHRPGSEAQRPRTAPECHPPALACTRKRRRSTSPSIGSSAGPFLLLRGLLRGGCGERCGGELCARRSGATIACARSVER